VPTKAALSLLLLSWKGKKKYNERLIGQDKDRERSLTNYHHRQNRLDLGKLIYYQSNQSRVMRTKTKSLKHLPFYPHHSILPKLNFTPKFSTSSLQAAQENGEWRLQSVHHMLYVLLLLPQEKDSSQSSLAPERVPSCRRQFFMNFSSISPWTALLHKLLQHGSFPRGAFLQEPAAPTLVHHSITSPARKPVPAWVLFSMGPQILPGTCSSAGFPQAHNLLQAHPLAPV